MNADALPSANGRSRWRRSIQRLPIQGASGAGRRLAAVVGVFIALITAIVGYNADATSRERGQAVVVNVASRQRTIAERYIKDVILALEGASVDPAEDAAILRTTADAMLRGGTVLAVQGADQTTRIPPVSTNWRVIAKLRQERRLIEQLIATGDRMLLERGKSPGYPAELQRLRVLGALVGTITNDAVGEMTLDAQHSLGRVVQVGVVLGVLGALAALAMALILRKAAQNQAAHFRALVHNSSDLVTVLGRDGVIRYEGPAAERALGFTPARLRGTSLFDHIHAGDVSGVQTALDELGGRPGSTTNVDYRRRTADGDWRHLESVATNLLDDPVVRGVVLNSRDVSERKRTERTLEVLQSERARLLDRTVDATEQERTRVAMELHDGPVQHLSALALKLETAGLALRKLTSPEPATTMVDRVRIRLQDEVAGLRRIMRELRPPALDERGLEAALMDHLNGVATQSGLECTVESTLEHRLDTTQETLLYRVAQEALTNVAKHASATHAWVSLRPLDDHVELRIRDDGAGFDPAGVSELAAAGHFGLIGMRERVEMAGGRWEVTSSPGKGTDVRALLPHSTDAVSWLGRQRMGSRMGGPQPTLVREVRDRTGSTEEPALHDDTKASHAGRT